MMLGLFYSISVKADSFDSNGIWYEILSETEVGVCSSSTKYSGNIVIPESVEFGNKKYQVVSVQDYAFTASTITSVSIPNSVISIGVAAFLQCKNLTSITIPGSVIKVYDSAFMSCNNLQSIELLCPLDVVSEYMFSGCTSLKSISLPNTVTIIEKVAFSGCSSLSSIDFSNSLVKIGEYAFSDCTNLTSISFPQNLQTIGPSSFMGCKSLQTITIPNSVQEIGSSAFSGCTNMQIVNSEILSPFDIGASAFSTRSNAILQVPKGTKEKYMQFLGWVNNFKVIKEVGDNIITLSASGNGQIEYNSTIVRNGSKLFSIGDGEISLTLKPDSRYYIKSVYVNGVAVTSNVIDNQLTVGVASDITIDVEFEAIPVTTYTLSIKSIGSGSAIYGGEVIRGTTKSYTLNEGTSATITFEPDAGYRIKTLKVNNTAVSATTSYTVTVNANTSVEVEFEAIPPTTYTLSIKATGNGSASYGGDAIRGTTKSYTLNEGTSATITFTPDAGYRIKTLKVNNTAVSATTSYTVTVNANTSVEVEFEAIPVNTYTLSIKATGNGSASYGGDAIRGTTKSYILNEGTSVTITFTPDAGYRIKTLKVNNTAVTATTSYTVTVNANTSVEVEFEAIPVATYTLSIKATGNGSASYGRDAIRGTTKSYTLNEGTSATITFTPDAGYRIKTLKVNNTAVSATTSYTVTVNANTSVEVEFEAIPVTTYTLSIKATGNGSASYGGDAIRGTTKSYTLNDGTSATITFTPDAGYRIKTLKVNNTAVSATTSYTVTVNANTSVEVEFEAIPPCTLSIKAMGNGSASYNGDVIRETTKSYTVDGGASITVTFNPDEGYRVKSLKVNGSNVAVSSTYKTTISADTKIEVEFEEIPPNTYTLSIKATGNGSATYDGNTIREAKEKYSVVEGTNISVSFSADEGCRIKSLTVNGVSETISDDYEATINADTSIEVEFEEIPVPTYSLTITALGNGSALYDSEEIRETTKSYTVKEGANVAVGFTPDDGYWTTSLKVNGTSIRTVPEYTATIHEDISIEVEFGESPSTIMTDDVTYRVESASEHTIIVTEVNDGLVLEIPERINYQEEEWIVTGMEEDVLDSHEETAAIIWNPAAPFTGRVSNPNLLLYVTDASYAPANIKNVVVNGNASSITLTDAQGGNNFYCPRVFTAQQITYTHRYGMRTGIGESRGWETIALPFDVQRYSLSEKGEIMPFKNWESGSDPYPFWLYELSAGGFTEADGIKANTPYIISLPNNDKYVADYRLNGRVTFSAENVEVKTSDDIETSTYSDRTFVPNFTVQESNEGYYALNVNSEYDMYQGGENEGSRFILNLRRIHPFEAYMTTTSNTRSIGIFDDMTTAIKGIEVISGEKVVRVYDLSGKLLRVGTSIEVIRQELPAGVYIVNHQKIIIK